MAQIIRMPEVLAGAREATITTWLVSEGDAVSDGGTLAEAETEKAVVELPLEHSGVVGHLLVREGQAVEVGKPIAVILEHADEQFDLADFSVTGDEEAPPQVAADSTPQQVAAPRTQAPAPNGSGRGRLFASPLVRKIAREKDVDLSQLQGSGPHGRIARRDLETYLHKATRTAQKATESSRVSGSPVVASSTTPHTGMRRAIARRLTESQASVPHFYLRAGCNVDRLIALRQEINTTSPTRVSLNDLVIRAVAVAYGVVPEANVVWTDEAMLTFSSVDVALAVSTDQGLVTPVVRDVAGKSISQLSAAVADLVTRARQGRLRQDELEGGTFTVSNLGMYDIDEFTAIINPPHSGILAVGATREQAVVEQGAVVTRSVMVVTLSADHRALDGALAARWLRAFVNAVENPLSLLV